MGGRRLAIAAAVSALLAVLAMPPAGAAPESEAPGLRGDVVAAWHDPPVVRPHTQWHGYLQLAPGTAVLEGQVLQQHHAMGDAAQLQVLVPDGMVVENQYRRPAAGVYLYTRWTNRTAQTG